MKKKIFFILFCFISILFLTGCEIMKTPLTIEEFNKLAEDNQYYVVDSLEHFKDYEEIKGASIAVSSVGYQIEYYQLDTAANAKKMYNKNKITFDFLAILITSLDSQ